MIDEAELFRFYLLSTEVCNCFFLLTLTKLMVAVFAAAERIGHDRGTSRLGCSPDPWPYN